ncbi:MAG: hypothetical protein LBP59_12050 [Planctomycetaceae bacterium]|nr:hypothetical protein [Planctomycetaceae bacterium]
MRFREKVFCNKKIVPLVPLVPLVSHVPFVPHVSLVPQKLPKRNLINKISVIGYKLFALEFSFTFACLAFGRQALTLLNQ